MTRCQKLTKFVASGCLIVLLLESAIGAARRALLMAITRHEVNQCLNRGKPLVATDRMSLASYRIA